MNQDNETYNFINNSVILPEKFSCAVESYNPVRLTFTDGVYRLVKNDISILFEDFQSAVKYAETHYYEAWAFDKTVPGFIADWTVQSGPNDDDLTVTYGLAFEMFRLKRMIYVFSLRAAEYRKNPNDFKCAWDFINLHPAFFTKIDDLYWQTLDMAHMYKDMMINSKGEVVWALELGESIAPDYRSHYHDLNLDAYGSTIEKAFINLAKLVDKWHNDDGTYKERPDSGQSPTLQAINASVDAFKFQEIVKDF